MDFTSGASFAFGSNGLIAAKLTDVGRRLDQGAASVGSDIASASTLVVSGRSVRIWGSHLSYAGPGLADQGNTADVAWVAGAR